MKVDEIHINQNADTVFVVSFMYDGHNLETEPIPNTAKKSDVKDAITKTLKNWIANCAQDNMQEIVNQFENKSLEV